MKRETIKKANKILEKMDECENIIILLEDDDNIGLTKYYDRYSRSEKIDSNATLLVKNYYKTKLKDLQDELKALKDE